MDYFRTTAIKVIALLLFVPFFASCQGFMKNSIHYDTSKIAIIEFTGKTLIPFDSSYKSSFLSQSDLSNIDSILIASVTNWNNSLQADVKRWWTIDLSKRNYKMQLVAVVNSSGEKEVWVNCFCDTPNFDWQNKIYFVDDGETCFFNFKINLKKRTFFDFMVNSAA
jgi:hypothetical protein